MQSLAQHRSLAFGSVPSHSLCGSSDITSSLRLRIAKSLASRAPLPRSIDSSPRLCSGHASRPLICHAGSWLRIRQKRRCTRSSPSSRRCANSFTLAERSKLDRVASRPRFRCAEPLAPLLRIRARVQGRLWLRFSRFVVSKSTDPRLCDAAENLYSLVKEQRRSAGLYHDGVRRGFLCKSARRFGKLSDNREGPPVLAREFTS